MMWSHTLLLPLCFAQLVFALAKHCNGFHVNSSTTFSAHPRFVSHAIQCPNKGKPCTFDSKDVIVRDLCWNLTGFFINKSETKFTVPADKIKSISGDLVSDQQCYHQVDASKKVKLPPGSTGLTFATSNMSWLTGRAMGCDGDSFDAHIMAPIPNGIVFEPYQVNGKVSHLNAWIDRGMEISKGKVQDSFGFDVPLNDTKDSKDSKGSKNLASKSQDGLAAWTRALYILDAFLAIFLLAMAL